MRGGNVFGSRFVFRRSFLGYKGAKDRYCRARNMMERGVYDRVMKCAKPHGNMVVRRVTVSGKADGNAGEEH